MSEVNAFLVLAAFVLGGNLGVAFGAGLAAGIYVVLMRWRRA